MASYLESSARPVDMQGSQRKTLPDGTTYELTDEEIKIQQMVLDKYKEAKKYKRNFDKDWEKWYKLYSGQHWDGPRPDWKSTPVVNFIFSTIETIVPIMTDSSPQLVVAPAHPSCAQTAEVFGDIVKRIWVKNDMDLKLPVIVRNTLKYGTGFAKVWWREPEYGADDLGDVEISVVDPRHIFPSPGATDLKDAAWLIFAANVPIYHVECMYPDAKGKLVGGIWEEDLTVSKTITSQTASASSGIIGPVQSAVGGDGSGGSTTSSYPSTDASGKPIVDRSKLVTLVELWHREEGRMQLTVCANGIVLRNGESPFKHNKLPFVRFTDYDIPSSFWGMGEVQQLEKLQDFINKRRGQTQDILRICGNPPLVADANSGINPKAMTTRPGSIIYKNPGTDVKWLTPPQLPSALFEIQALDKQDFDAVSGIYDVTQGRKPKGIEAASAINELQEAAQTRLRLKVRNLEGSLRTMGQLIVDLVQEFYDEPRVIRLVASRNPNQPDFVYINHEIVDNEGNQVKINDVTTGKYDIEIGVGSTMPVNKARLYSEMKEMFELQIVDGQAVIENSSLSPAQQAKIIMRQGQAQQAQMAQQGMPPAPGAANTAGGLDPSAMASELQALQQG